MRGGGRALGDALAGRDILGCVLGGVLARRSAVESLTLAGGVMAGTAAAAAVGREGRHELPLVVAQVRQVAGGRGGRCAGPASHLGVEVEDGLGPERAVQAALAGP